MDSSIKNITALQTLYSLGVYHKFRACDDEKELTNWLRWSAFRIAEESSDYKEDLALVVNAVIKLAEGKLSDHRIRREFNRVWG